MTAMMMTRMVTMMTIQMMAMMMTMMTMITMMMMMTMMTMMTIMVMMKMMKMIKVIKMMKKLQAEYFKTKLDTKNYKSIVASPSHCEKQIVTTAWIFQINHQTAKTQKTRPLLDSLIINNLTICQLDKLDILQKLSDMILVLKKRQGTGRATARLVIKSLSIPNSVCLIAWDNLEIRGASK